MFAKGRGLSLVYDVSTALKPRRFVVLIVAHQRGIAPLQEPSLCLHPCPARVNHIKNGNGRYKLTRFPAKLQSLLAVCGQPIFLFCSAKVNKLFDFTLFYRLLLFCCCFCLRFGLLRAPHIGGELQPKSCRFFRSFRGRIFILIIWRQHAILVVVVVVVLETPLTDNQNTFKALQWKRVIRR